jgi:hypothetical protein
MAVELLIRDGSPAWWESPDIWVVPGTDPSGAAGPPVAGSTAYLWATLRNEGDTDVSQVRVDFWVADPSAQIRKSTANHIGASFADVAAGGSQDVLCLAPWHVTLLNDGHECVVVEATSPLDPLSPAPADPDVLDPPTYRQIAQRNLSVLTVSGMTRSELRITVHAGPHEEKTAVLELSAGAALPAPLLWSLGLEKGRYVPAQSISAGLSGRPPEGKEGVPETQTVQLDVPPGASVSAYLSVAARKPLTPGEYTVLTVTESDNGQVTGGISVVVEQSGSQKRGAA